MDLVGQYSKSILQQHTGGSIIKNHISLICMTIIGSVNGWFEISEFPSYELDEVTGVNDEYIYKSSAKLIQLFNST